MMEKKVTLLILFLIFLIHLKIVFAPPFYDPDTELCISDCDYQSGDYSKIDWDKADQSKVPANRIKEIPKEKVDVTRVQDISRLTGSQLQYDDNLNRLREWNQFNNDALSQALSGRTGRNVVIQGAENGEVTQNGFSVDAQFLRVEATSVNNCISCVYDGKKLIFKHADSVVTDKSASTNIDNFEGFADSFKVEKADSLLSGCLRFDNIKESEFSIFEGRVEAYVENGNNVTITDCSYSQSEFESKGNGSITINKDSKPRYEIKEGILKCKYGLNTDKLEAENTASVEIVNCFSCMTITPAGTYFYSDADIRKDFVINVPKESSVYKLCLRKNQAQQYSAYNGLMDFANKKIELNGIVNYLRYPLKDSQISSLLSSFVYKGLKNVNALFNYDRDLLFLEKASIKDTANNKNQITTTKPSNFYSIEEIEFDDGKVHRVVGLGSVNKEDVTQSIISNYESDSLDADVNIDDNILVQQAGESKVTILPPGHPRIISFLR